MDNKNIIPENQKTGLLLNADDIKLHREYFKEMCSLLGINCLYRTPIEGMKRYDMFGELDAHYNPPVMVSCVFEEYPQQYTMRKLGWLSELQESVSLIHVPYDLEDLQVGCIFIVPSGIDHAEGRVFRVLRMKTEAVYPASITCEIGPLFTDVATRSQVQDFKQSDQNMLDTADLYDDEEDFIGK